MRRSYPKFWGGFSTGDARRSLSSAHWLGITIGGRLACIGSAKIYPYGGHIGIVATREECRKQGLATALVSTMVRLITLKAPFAIINVARENDPAVRAYTRSGFRPYQESVLMRAVKKHRS